MNCRKVAILAWVFLPEATMPLRLKHSSNSKAVEAGRQEPGKCQQQEWIGALHPLNPKRNRNRLVVRMQY